MKSTPFAICATCCENLKEFGNEALELCLKVCEAHSNDEFLCFDSNVNKKTSDDSSMLEDYGYLISTEISATEIALKPVVKPIFSEGHEHIYCWCTYEK